MAHDAPHHHHHGHSHGHAHDHKHAHDHRHAPTLTVAEPRLITHRWSLLLSGAGERLAVVGALLALLWAVTLWALQ